MATLDFLRFSGLGKPKRMPFPSQRQGRNRARTKTVQNGFKDLATAIVVRWQHLGWTCQPGPSLYPYVGACGPS